ncbi:MAG: hypothetical protein R3253_10110, partial [Longimicrobiales bacterium]|nr:hypothetical protein [Longimicrobiales bacterium]
MNDPVRTLRAALRLLLVLLLTALPLAAPAAGQADATEWTPELSMQFRAVSSTTISPDGSLVAFVVREPLMEGEQSEYRSHVWVAATDGSWTRQFTRGEESASNPSFTPDGETLLFTTSRSGDNQVWALPLVGGEAYQVTEASEGVGSYAVSPDGSHLAYTMADPESEAWEQAKKEKRDVIVADSDYRYEHIYMGPLGDGMQPRAHQVTDGDFTVTGWDWAPDGRHIVFAHRTDPRINTGRLDGDISVVNTMEHGPDGGHTFTVRPLVMGEGVEDSPLVSPDGSLVAFISTGDQPEP